MLETADSLLPTPDLIGSLNEFTVEMLNSYRASSNTIREHYGIELSVLAGAYGYRQVLELVQNAADALPPGCEAGAAAPGPNKIHVMLRENRLYVANTGAPLSVEGLRALLWSNMSPKRGKQIGRFGVGFKSLLKLEGRIDIFTRASGAIRFDPDRCRQELSKEFGLPDVPGLRLAWPLPEDERRKDPLLDELSWSETIVRVEINSGDSLSQLQDEIRRFPAEFLLFIPPDTHMDLDDGVSTRRELRVAVDERWRVLKDGVNETRWLVATREVQITDEAARHDATEVHWREIAPVSWAVPKSVHGEQAGRFWAFFPTQSLTYVPGILNAPWKLNSDRSAIVPGAWNSALMSEAASLIAETISLLSSPTDPGRLLDAFPRQMVWGEVAAPFVNSLWTALTKEVFLPDGVGELRPATSLCRPPTDTKALLERWCKLAGPAERARYVHPTCLRFQRTSRLNELAERLAKGVHSPKLPGLRHSSAKTWFQQVSVLQPEAAVEVLRLAEEFKKLDQRAWSACRSDVEIVLTEDNRLVSAGSAVMARAGSAIPGRSVVHEAITADSEAARILRDVLGVPDPDYNGWYDVLERAKPNESSTAAGESWREFWALLREATDDAQAKYLEQHWRAIRCLRVDGEWVLPHETLLPGRVVGHTDSLDNRAFLVDQEFHSKDTNLLRQLRVSDWPNGDYEFSLKQEKLLKGRLQLLEEWVIRQREAYRKNPNHRNRPDNSLLWAKDFVLPEAAELLNRLTGPPRSRLTSLILDRWKRGDFPATLKFGHSTREIYIDEDVPHPLPWLLLRYGTVEIGSASVRLAALFARREEVGLDAYRESRNIRGRLDCLVSHSPPVELESTDIQAMWQALLKVALNETCVEPSCLIKLWAGAAKDGVVPDLLPGPSGSVAIDEVLVTTSPALADAVVKTGRLAVRLDERTLRTWVGRGATDLAAIVRLDPAEAQCSPELLAETFPDLLEVTKEEIHDSAMCVPVPGLNVRIQDGSDLIPLPCLYCEGRLLVDLEALESVSRADRYGVLVDELTASDWLSCTPDEARRLLGEAGVDARRAAVAAGATLTERLLLAVGRRREPLIEALGELAELSLIQQCDGTQLSELTLAHLGPLALHRLHQALRDEGLNPPAAPNPEANLVFVTSLGFPPEFATSPDARREPEVIISGPLPLPQLHGFQEEVKAGIREILDGCTPRRRGVVSLPTGGGKTRVTVQAAVEFVLKPEGENRSVVWIAQTDELCEQAVQAFRQVWVNCGAERTDLRIVRLWGGQPVPAPAASGRPVVVLATIQTLNQRLRLPEYCWLLNPGLVIVDECHHAIAPSYSRVLHWLDGGRRVPDSLAIPVIGLSATPFRTDEEESARLAQRFDRFWLPADQHTLHQRLRDEGILAQVDYQELPSPSELIETELQQLSALPSEDDGFKLQTILNAINNRMGGNELRNAMLVEHLRAAREQSILLFANSVRHSVEMAARLNLAGIPAAAVSATTPRATRRYFLDRFQSGEVRVLCNHSVLTTGFDAPKTDLVLIARIVFSPIRYMQMVGRGLRGEKNGGTQRCRIVTVVDNLGRFKDRLAYHYCRKHYTAG